VDSPEITRSNLHGGEVHLKAYLASAGAETEVFPGPGIIAGCRLDESMLKAKAG
jgi:hypothetical protein